jgi:hypothetical protein
MVTEYPYRLNNLWILKIARIYGESSFRDVRLGVTRYRKVKPPKPIFRRVNPVQVRMGPFVDISPPLPTLDMTSGCWSCPYICPNSDSIGDGVPGLKLLVWARNKRHPEHSSGERWEKEPYLPLEQITVEDRDYPRYPAVHRFGARGKKPIALDYYKFPCSIPGIKWVKKANDHFRISWRPWEKSPDSAYTSVKDRDRSPAVVWCLLVTGNGLHGCWLDLPTAQRLTAANIVSMDLLTLHRPCHPKRIIRLGAIYTQKIAPGDIKFRAPRPGPQERSWFAFADLGSKKGGSIVDLVKGEFTRAFKKSLIGQQFNPRLIYQLGSGAPSPINHIGQTLNRQYIDKGRFYLTQQCSDECKGLLRYSSRGEVVCDDCQTVHESIATTEYMNAETPDEEELADFSEEPETARKEPLQTDQWKQWNEESGKYLRQGVKLKRTARTLNTTDIKRRQIGRTCSEIGCTINQLKRSTVLQHKFINKFEELYHKQLTKQGLAAKIEFFGGSR